MEKTYLVAGASWVAEVKLSNTEDLSINNIQFEAATRAIEALYGKRDDIPINRHPPIRLTEEQKSGDELHAALVHLLTEELEEGCGIGVLLCIMDSEDNTDKTKDSEWYILSKPILENVGFPRLVQKFNEKYPDKSVKRP